LHGGKHGKARRAWQARTGRFQKSLEIINARGRKFCLDGVAMKNGEKHFALTACHAGGIDALIAKPINHGAGL
jgi:hypothetical protein